MMGVHIDRKGPLSAFRLTETAGNLLRYGSQVVGVGAIQTMKSLPSLTPTGMVWPAEAGANLPSRRKLMFVIQGRF